MLLEQRKTNEQLDLQTELLARQTAAMEVQALVAGMSLHSVSQAKSLEYGDAIRRRLDAMIAGEA